MHFIRCLLLFVASIWCAASAVADWQYVVKPGDTLIGIADQYLQRQHDWPLLQSLNRVADPRRLKPGEHIRIPLHLLRLEAAPATVIHVRGSVKRVRGALSSDVVVGDMLRSGEELVTDADSNVSLRFADGSRLLVSERSRLVFIKLSRYRGTGMAETVIRLDEGDLENRVETQRAPAGQYRIESEALNLGVRGTRFRAEVAADGTARSGVAQGSVAASAGQASQKVVLDAGFGTLARPGEAPAAPIKLAPGPDLASLASRIEYLPVRLSWPRSPQAVRWRTQIFPVDNEDALLLDAVLDEPSTSWTDLPDGQYRLRVRAVMENGLEGLESLHDFELAARPEAPLALAPQAGQRVRGDSVTMRWAQPHGVAGYRLQLAANAEFEPVLVDLPALNEAEARIDLPPGDYFWRLASIDSKGHQGPVGPTQGFSQMLLPEGPAPGTAEVQKDATVLQWHASEPGLTWRVQVARDADFADVITDEQVSEPQFRLVSGNERVVHVRVQAIDQDGVAGPFGVPQQIDMPSDPPRWWLMVLPLLLVL